MPPIHLHPESVAGSNADAGQLVRFFRFSFLTTRKEGASTQFGGEWESIS